MSDNAWYSGESVFGYGQDNTLNTVRELVSSEFLVNSMHLEMGILNFIVAPVAPSPRENFKRLATKMKGRGYIPFLRRENNQYVIRVASRPTTRPSRNLVNLGLFVVTCLTIFVSGYFAFSNPVYTDYLLRGSNLILSAILFTVCILAILGLHELGHKIVSQTKGIDASLPYFIPGLPPVGTFGAVILQKEPPVNRNELFDVGLSGPMVSFVLTAIVALIGIVFSFQVPESQVSQWISQGYLSYGPSPLLLDIIQYLVWGTGVPGKVLVTTPIVTAAWIGALVTFLNLFPAWQLDGGHVAQAVLNKRGYEILSLAATVGLLLAGFWLMAILIFMMRGSRGMEPLDDVSPLSTSRKAMVPLVIAIFALCFVIFW